MTHLRLAPGLELPIDGVTKKFGFFGQNGTGKTYAATKLAELMLDAGAQIVVVDPVGKWYGLRLAANGKDPSGIEIPVFGGLHGDIPLQSTAGELIADVIVDRGISAVLDVSQFEYDTDRARFMEHFARRLFHRKKASPSAIHVFIEEAQEFLPISPQKGEEKMLHEVLRIGKIGRNHGFGWTLITPRPQEITTKARNLSEVVLAFQLNGTHERKAIAEWVKEKGQDLDVVDLLPKLKQGTAHAWSPSWLEFSGTVHINKKRTFDASATPKVGAKAIEPKPLGSIDLEQLRTSMAATIEKAKAEDPKELQKRIRELEAQIRKGAPATTAAPDPAALQRQVDRAVDAATREHGQQLREVKSQLAIARRLLAGANAVVAKLPEMLDSATAALDVAGESLAERSPAPSVGELAVRRASSAAAAPSSVAPVRRPILAKVETTFGSEDGALAKGERATLTAIAQHEDGVDREQLSALTGYSRSTRNLYLQRLARPGYIVVQGDTIHATDEGRAALGADFEPMPTGDALREYWIGRLPEGERRVLQALASVWPDAMDRDALSAHTGYSRSTRNLYIQRLQRKKIVESVGSDVAVSKLLFDGGR